MNIELAGVFLYWTENSTRTGKHINIELAGVFFYYTADSARTGKHMKTEQVGVFFNRLQTVQGLANT